MESRTELKQQLGPGRRKGNEAQFIEDDQVKGQSPGDELL